MRRLGLETTGHRHSSLRPPYTYDCKLTSTLRYSEIGTGMWKMNRVWQCALESFLR